MNALIRCGCSNTTYIVYDGNYCDSRCSYHTIHSDCKLFLIRLRLDREEGRFKRCADCRKAKVLSEYPDD